MGSAVGFLVVPRLTRSRQDRRVAARRREDGQRRVARLNFACRHQVSGRGRAIDCPCVIDASHELLVTYQEAQPPCKSSVVQSALQCCDASATALSLRLGPAGLRALDEIARRRGVTRAEAARQAIAETAERERRRAGLAAEAASLARDPAYVAEAREVAALMDGPQGRQYAV